MSFADTDSTDLWDEIHRHLGIEDEEGKISPLVTLVKPIRLVTLIKQDTIVLGQDTCPPGSVDLPSSDGPSPDTGGLHAILDRRLAAYDRERETADRVRHDELLAAVDQRLEATSRMDRSGGAGRSALTFDDCQPKLETLLERLETRLRGELAGGSRPPARAGAYTDGILNEAIHSMRSELRAVRSLLTQEPPRSGEYAKTETAPLTPSSAEPEARSSGQSAAAHLAPPRDSPSGLPAVATQGSAEARVGGPARPWRTLFPWSSLLVLSLAFVFFTCGVVAHAMLARAPLDPDSEVARPASGAAPAAADQDRPNPAVAEASPPPSDRATSWPSSGATEPDRPALLDSDGDGLYDPGQPGLTASRIDRCPNTPGPSERQGCPELNGDDELPERLKALEGVIEGVHFDVDRATLRPDSIEILDRAITVLREHPAARIEISGHTDSAGGYQHNIELSQARAETVRGYLVDRGLAADRLETAGYGPDRPIDDNRTRAGRLRNRRIEFKLL